MGKLSDSVSAGASTTTVPDLLYGDGSDGSVTLDGSTTILGMVPSANVYTQARDLFCDILTINTGVTLISNGYRLFAKTKIAGAGTIKGSGADGAIGGVGASGLGIGTLPGQAGGGSQTPGVDGGTIPRGYTGAGGNGGAGNGGAGFAGGLAGSALTANAGDIGLAIMAIMGAGVGQGFTFMGTSRTGGGGGGGNSGGFSGEEGGGGGASGRYMVVCAPTFDSTITIANKGGNGGPGKGAVRASGGGGGGGGGYIVLVRGAGGTSPTTNVAGGTGGGGVAGGANGVNGGNGTVRLFLVGP